MIEQHTRMFEMLQFEMLNLHVIYSRHRIVSRIEFRSLEWFVLNPENNKYFLIYRVGSCALVAQSASIMESSPILSNLG